MPNGITLTQSYEEKRDLLTDMDYVRDNSLVTQRRHTYDDLARPETRDTRYPNKSISHNDSFAYNHRSELTGALLDNSAYTYAYDNMGNREIAQEAAEGITYAENELNQYTRISTDGSSLITCAYDYAGRRFEKKVTTKDANTTHRRHIYRGYLQIAAVNFKTNAPTPDLPSTRLSSLACYAVTS